MINEQKNTTPPDILMLVSAHCTYCGPMMQVLTELMKQGLMAELRIVNIEKNSELAKKYNVRSVPWLKIGPFELSGSRTKQELILWMERASSFDGITDYLEEILAEGNIQSAIKLVEKYPQALENVIDLMANPDAKINVHLGVGVIIEDIAESESFKIITSRLVDYLSHKDARIRSDSCHYLSLTKNRAYVSEIEKLLLDENEEVREIAQDSLQELAID